MGRLAEASRGLQEPAKGIEREGLDAMALAAGHRGRPQEGIDDRLLGRFDDRLEEGRESFVGQKTRGTQAGAAGSQAVLRGGAEGDDVVAAPVGRRSSRPA